MLRWRNKVTGPQLEGEDTALGGKMAEGKLHGQKAATKSYFPWPKWKRQTNTSERPAAKKAERRIMVASHPVAMEEFKVWFGSVLGGPRTWSILPKLKFMNR